jgi:hypothetical protein
VMAAPRPAYWEIATAYIEEGYRAWQARELASAIAVEDALGLSALEGIDWHAELASLRLIAVEGADNAGGYYHLLPRGLAVAERLPDLKQLLAQQTATITRSVMPDEDKRKAGFSLRDEIYKTALNKGVDVAIQNAPAVWTLVRSLYGALPPDWKAAPDARRRDLRRAASHDSADLHAPKTIGTRR